MEGFPEGRVPLSQEQRLIAVQTEPCRLFHLVLFPSQWTADVFAS